MHSDPLPLQLNSISQNYPFDPWETFCMIPGQERYIEIGINSLISVSVHILSEIFSREKKICTGLKDGLMQHSSQGSDG
jgi:hypothetical protein